jgi:hypothetical protein
MTLVFGAAEGVGPHGPEVYNVVYKMQRRFASSRIDQKLDIYDIGGRLAVIADY